MSIDPTLSLFHSGVGFLLLALAIISVVIAVFIAVKPAVDPENSALVRAANILGAIELTAAVVVTITGVTAAFMGSIPLSELWLWLSLSSMIFYIVANVWVTRPARMAVAVGGSAVKTGMQVILQIGHVLLVSVTLILMIIQPV